MKDKLSAEIWNQHYMGDKGEFTFFINLVDGYFAKKLSINRTLPIDEFYGGNVPIFKNKK